MTATATRKLKLRLLLDGIECPVSGADVSITKGAAATASIRVIAHPSVMRLKPRTLVLLFYYDWLSDHGDSSDKGYKLLFSGDLIGVEYNKTNASRDATLVCEDHSSYYDIGYAYYTLSDLDTVAKITEERAQFVGAQRGFFQATGTNDLTGIIKQIFDTGETPRSEGFRSVQGMLGSIIRVIEVFVGIGNAAAANQFFRFNTRRLGLMGQLGVYANDSTAARLLNGQYITDFIKRRAEQLGELVTLRQIIDLLLGYMYYGMSPNPCAMYVAERDVKNPTDLAPLKAAATELSVYIAKDMATLSKDKRQLVRLGLAADAVASQLKLADVTVIDDALPFYRFVAAAKELVSEPSIYAQCERVFSATVRLYGDSALDPTQSEVDVVKAELSVIIDAEVASIKDAQRLRTTLITPDLFFAVAPRCNVLFPDMYGQLRYGSRISKEPTRLHLTTNMDAALFGVEGAGDLIYYAPSIEQLREVQSRSVTTVEQENTSQVPVFARPFDHELYTGVIPSFSQVDRLAFMVAKDGADTGDLTDDGRVNDFFVRTANYQYIKQKLASRSLSASGPFNPAAVVGFPMVVIDGTAVPGGVDRFQSPQSATADNEHYVGVLVGLSHSISQEGAASTSYQLQYARPHRGQDDEFLRRLVTEDFGFPDAVLPLEEAIRPQFIDRAYSAPNIGNDVYKELLGCDSVTDAAAALGASKVKLVDLPDGAPARILEGVTQETAIDQIAYVYAGSGNKADWAERWVRRPVASMNEALEYYRLGFVFSSEEARTSKYVSAIDVVYVEKTAPPPPGYRVATKQEVAALQAAVHPDLDVRLARHAAVVEYANKVSNRALRG